jgi:hypothetical protein
MFCPGCGQQQMSNETKFCSRCGLPLGIVSEVLMYGGYLPQLAELDKKKKPLLTRRNGVAFSVIWCLFFLLIMAPLWGILDIEKLAGASAVIGIFGGTIWMFASLMFLKKEPKFNLPLYSPQDQSHLPGAQGHSALPPQQSIPASVYAAPSAGSWRDTNDLQPGSVTESTTRLLEKDDKQ